MCSKPSLVEQQSNERHRVLMDTLDVRISEAIDGGAVF
jgi:hypothetical protein